MSKLRRRPYHQFPRELLGWFSEEWNGFCDAHNPEYRKQMRMISWRRP